MKKVPYEPGENEEGVDGGEEGEGVKHIQNDVGVAQMYLWREGEVLIKSRQMLTGIEKQREAEK